MKSILLFTVIGIRQLCVDALESVCSGDGTCVPVQDDVVIPRTANTAGAAPELPVDCVDRHANCNLYERQDQCNENPGWMIVNCPLSCQACHLRDRNVRCSKEFLNMTDQEPAFMKPGDVDKLFRGIVEKYGDALGITVHSEDPWYL